MLPGVQPKGRLSTKRLLAIEGGMDDSFLANQNSQDPIPQKPLNFAVETTRNEATMDPSTVSRGDDRDSKPENLVNIDITKEDEKTFVTQKMHEAAAAEESRNLGKEESL